METQPDSLASSEPSQIGQEFIVVAVGEEFFDKKLYFVCLLCEKTTQKYTKLNSHLISTCHRKNFLKRNFPSTFETIESLNVTDEDKLGKILECICKEVIKNIEPRDFHELNYAVYEETPGIDEELLAAVTPYDNSLEYVENMNNVLKVAFGGAQNGEVAEDEMVEVQDSLEEEKTKEVPEELTSVSSDEDEDNIEIVRTDSQKVIKDTRQEALLSLFQEKLKKEEIELDKKFSVYSRHPEAYPGYEEEWKNFYTQNSYGIAVQSQEMRTQINYLPMWRVYWASRVRELKQKELSMIQTMLRSQLNLEEESEYETPVKRRKIDEKIVSDEDRICFAYHIAYEHFQRGVFVSPEEVIEMVKIMSNQRLHQQSCDLNDNDLIMLYENFSNLSSSEQEDFLSVLKCVEFRDPERYESLKSQMNKK